MSPWNYNSIFLSFFEGGEGDQSECLSAVQTNHHLNSVKASVVMGNIPTWQPESSFSHYRITLPPIKRTSRKGCWNSLKWDPWEQLKEIIDPLVSINHSDKNALVCYLLKKNSCRIYPVQNFGHCKCPCGTLRVFGSYYEKTHLHYNEMRLFLVIRNWLTASFSGLQTFTQRMWSSSQSMGLSL